MLREIVEASKEQIAKVIEFIPTSGGPSWLVQMVDKKLKPAQGWKPTKVKFLGAKEGDFEKGDIVILKNLEAGGWSGAQGLEATAVYSKKHNK